jgi:carbonic anhydrase/acetyltransferase-like protein (isoleucine patch superfamily)
VHALWLSNLWPQIEMVERITQSPLSTAWRLLRAVRPTPSATRWAVARSFNQVGRGVEIHPSAVVELSVLGDGVKVGPFALVRGAVLGRDVRVEERANVMFSTLGDRCYVSKNSTVFACLGYPDADLCINGMQYCVAGRRSALTSLVRPMDMKYRGDVTLRLDGRTIAVRELMVGSCFGHDSFVGPEVLIGPGREIPNRTVVAPRPGTVMTRVDAAVTRDGGLAYVQDGVLRPMQEGGDK